MARKRNMKKRLTAEQIADCVRIGVLMARHIEENRDAAEWQDDDGNTWLDYSIVLSGDFAPIEREYQDGTPVEYDDDLSELRDYFDKAKDFFAGQAKYAPHQDTRDAAGERAEWLAGIIDKLDKPKESRASKAARKLGESKVNDLLNL